MPSANSAAWARGQAQTNATPARPTRPSSPTISAYSFSQTATPTHSKANVVSRTVIEGKIKKDRDGASVRMYLKLSVPLDTLTSTTIPLFAEENVKILNAQVHPLDANSAPYNFSSSVSPLLHKASRALGLPARLNTDYRSLFDDTTNNGTPLHSRASSTKRMVNMDSNSTLDAKYSGQITVSDYRVVFVLPKEFPPQQGQEDRNDDGGYLSRINPVMSTGASRRRLSISDRPVLHFMVAIEAWIPLATKPPRAPFMVSIPTPPRCLHNNIRLRIYSPTPPASNSFASLSSVEDDSGSPWDISSEPQVTRNPMRYSRGASSYNDLADDESSDSSILADESGLSGTFPSTDRIRVRWAKPTKVFVSSDTDTRRRVGVEQSSGQMICTVLDRQDNGDDRPATVVMGVEYEGRATGVWYSGVETLLGLDINLESKNSEVEWLPDSPLWMVEGGEGFTGWKFGSAPHSLARHTSRDSLLGPVGSSSNGPPPQMRHDSISSTSSLLRAPLPNQPVPEYSFESSETPDGSEISSYPTSIPASSVYAITGSSRGDPITPPGAPLTIHLNMNDLAFSSNGSLNCFTFRIYGTILVTPRVNASSSRSLHKYSVYGNDRTDDPVGLPKFTVLAADKESTAWVVKNEISSTDDSTINVEVHSMLGNLRDAQSRKTVLQQGSSTRCGEEGARIVLRTLRSRTKGDGRSHFRDTSAEHHTPKLTSSMVLRPNNTTAESPVRPLRQGPLMIPWVSITITPLITVPSLGNAPSEHVVRVSLPVVPDENNDWLVFGVPHRTSSEKPEYSPIDIICASVEGIPVRYERSVPRGKQKEITQSVPHHATDERTVELRVQPGLTAGNLLLEYTVAHSPELLSEKGKVTWEAALPLLPLPVGRLEVIVQQPSGFDISVITNLQREITSPSGYYAMHWSADKGFHPVIQVSLYEGLSPKTKTIRVPWRWIVGATMSIVLIGVWLILLFSLLSMDAEFRLMKQALIEISRQPPAPSWAPPPPIIQTVTTTVFVSPTPRENFNRETETTRSTASIISLPTTIATPSIIDIRNPKSTPQPLPTNPTEKLQIKLDNALAPLYQFPLTWGLHFDLPPVAEETMEKVMQSLHKTWQILRKLYHYPLPPPT